MTEEVKIWRIPAGSEITPEVKAEALAAGAVAIQRVGADAPGLVVKVAAEAAPEPTVEERLAALEAVVEAALPEAFAAVKAGPVKVH